MSVRFFIIIGFLSLMLACHAHGDDSSTLPGAGFGADRYATLWTKSPFAIATPEAGAASQDFELVGLAQFDGVSYASLIDKQSNEHFVLSSDKPVKNLTLVSIAHTADGTSAVIQRNGEILTLKQDNSASVAPPAGPTLVGQAIAPMPAFPQVNPSVGGMPPSFFRHPQIRMHRRPITFPPPSGSQ
jgi:hypothetical protein